MNDVQDEGNQSEKPHNQVGLMSEMYTYIFLYSLQ